MNILVLTPWYPTKVHTYSGIFVREYAKAIRDHCNVIVLHCGVVDQTLPSWWAIEKEHDPELTDGIPTYRVMFKRSPIWGISFIRYIGSVYRATRKLLNQHWRPDLVHAHTDGAGLLAVLIGKLLDIPVVISEHSSGFARGLLSKYALFQAKIVFQLADTVLPVSQALQKTLQQNGVRAIFQVVPNIVDTSLFHFQSQSLNSDGIIRLLAVSSSDENKGLAILFSALPMVSWNGRPWRLDVVGVGKEPQDMRLHKIVNDLGFSSNVIFRGRMHKTDVAQMMRAADLFVLSSIVETFSVATAEALASGLPVLVTRCGGPEEFVTKHAGMIVSPGEAGELASALEKMIELLPTYDRTAIANEAKERFGAASLGGTLYELYQKLVKNYSHNRAN